MLKDSHGLIPEYDAYVELVNSGKPISKEVRASLENVHDYIERFTYNPEYPHKLITFIERYIYLQKGGDGTTFKLLPEQKFWIAMLGFIHDDGRPVVNHFFLMLGAGSGKSTFMGALGLASLIVGHDRGSDVIILANSREQANITYRVAMEMADDDRSDLHKAVDDGYIEPLRSKIRFNPTNSVMEIKPSRTETIDGSDAKVIIFDEIHAYEGKTDAIENMRKSTSVKRPNGYTMWFISTNGQVRGDTFDHYFDMAVDNIMASPDERDYGFFPMLYKLDSPEEALDKNQYEKATPFINKISSPDILYENIMRARNIPVAQSEIMAKSFNIPMNSFEAIFTTDLLTQQQGKPQYNGGLVHVGFDMSNVNDLTAISYVQHDSHGLHVDTVAFVTKTEYDEAPAYRRAKYDEFIAEGSLIKLETARITHEFILAYNEEHLAKNNLTAISYTGDAYDTLFNAKVEERYGMVNTLAMTVKNMSAITKVYIGLLKDGKVNIPNQLSLWSHENLRVKTDEKGNIYPNKAKARDKIDPVISVLMGFSQTYTDTYIDWSAT